MSDERKATSGKRRAGQEEPDQREVVPPGRTRPPPEIDASSATDRSPPVAARPPEGVRLSSTAIVMVGILIGSLAGFGREIVTAGLLGATGEADLYLIAFAVPELLIVLTLTILAPALVPALAAADRPNNAVPSPESRVAGRELRGGRGAVGRAPDRRGQVVAGTDGPSEFGRLSFALGTWLTIGLVLLVAGLEIAGPLVVGLLGLGLAPAELAQTLELMRLMLLGTVGLGVSAAAIAALTARRRFTGPALVTAAYNLAFLVTAALLYPIVGLVGFGWAVVAGVAAGLLILAPAVARGQIELRPAWRHPGVRRAFTLVAPVAIGYLLHHLAFFADRSIGSFLPRGELAALNYAFRLTLVVEQAVGIAVATVALPALAGHAVAGQVTAVRETLAAALRLVTILAWPAMGLLVILATPVVRLIYERGQFDARATELTVAAVLALSVGLFADTLAQPIWRYFYATEAGGVIVGVNGAKTILRIGLNLLLVPIAGYLGLALSITVGLTAQLVVLYWVADRRLAGLHRARAWQGLGRGVAAGTLALAVSLGLAFGLGDTADRSSFAQALVVGGAVVAAGLTFLGAAWLLRLAEVRALTDRLAALARRRRTVDRRP